jgi:PhzF family phenazine biosynthesis protein
MLVKAYKINAFAKTPEGGNPAGVVVHADNLPVKKMQEVAHIIGVSETAFVMKSNIADFEVRFFTPTSEVDLCGHATIGTFAVLLGRKIIKPGIYSQQTRAGILCVEAREDGTIMMNQATPVFSKELGKTAAAEIADALCISQDSLLSDLPVQIVSTGLADLLVPVRSLDILNGIRPDFVKVRDISRKYKAVGVHLFTLETLLGSTAHCRDLAPIVGIPEESATGTASGALACYLYRHGRISKDSVENIVFEQGYSMGLPSEILASLRVEAGEIMEVRIGGKALGRTSTEVEV